MEPSKAVKEYKDELIKAQVQNELVGKVTVEKKWLVKKLKSLGLSNRKQLVDLKPSLLLLVIAGVLFSHRRWVYAQTL
jgi:putative transposase